MYGMNGSRPTEIDPAVLSRWEQAGASAPRLVAARLARMMLDGRLAPGQALPDNVGLARELGYGTESVAAGKRLLGTAGYAVKERATAAGGARLVWVAAVGPAPGT